MHIVDKEMGVRSTERDITKTNNPKNNTKKNVGRFI
jgi:hypothetical protein